MKLALLLFGAIFLGFAYLLGHYALAQELAEVRVLVELEPLFRGAVEQSTLALQTLVPYPCYVGIAVSVWVIVVALVGLYSAGRRAWPLLLGLGALTAACWGQILIFRDVYQPGGALLVLGFVLAALLGFFRPMAEAAGFPLLSGRRAERRPPPLTLFEVTAVFVVLLVALTVRTYALNEMTDGFDGEVLADMIMSRTVHGLQNFIGYEFIATATGLLQQLVQNLSFQLFGTSALSLRYGIALVGTVIVLLGYGLVRRMAGPKPALVAATLMTFAPEQLYWSRYEITQFAAVLLVAMVTLNLGVWLMRSLSLSSVLAAALWTPFCRLIYTGGWTLVAFPALLALHSLILGRVSRWRGLYALPILALGVVLWGFAPSLVRWAVVDSSVPFVSPTTVYNSSFLRRSGELGELSTVDLIGAQIESISARVSSVTGNFFDNCRIFTHWYARSSIMGDKHLTVTNSGLTIWAFCGLAYLLGQLRDPRAFSVLILFGLGLAPAVMSPDPFPRRMLMVFLTLPIGAALFSAALGRLATEVDARFAAFLLYAGVCVALPAIAMTSAHSYFVRPMGPSWLIRDSRFTRPLFAASDAVFHDLAYFEMGNKGLGVGFANLDTMLRRDLAYELVERQEWPAVALRMRPRYSDYMARIVWERSKREQMAMSASVDRATFLFRDSPESEASLEVVRQLYPRSPPVRGGKNLISVTVGEDAVAERRHPRIHLAAGASPGAVLKGFRSPIEASHDDMTRVEAAALIDKDGWYAWHLEPPCGAARIDLDQRPVAWGEERPGLRGTHLVSLQLPAECERPVSLLLQALSAGARPLTPGDLFSPETAALPALRSRAYEIFDGFEEAELVATFDHGVSDFAVDTGRGFSVAGRIGDVWSIFRLDMDGERLTSWPVTGSGQVFSIAVAADGTHAILSVDGLRLFDRDGELLAESKFDALPACDVEFWGTDRVLVSHYGKDAILIFDRAATLVDQVKSLPGVPEPIFGPWTIATDPRGRLFLGDSSARAFVVQVPVEEFRPISTRSFSTEGMQHGVALDPRDRILVPAKVGFQVFRPDGTRLVARDPARDLTDRRFGKHPVAVTSGETLYVFAVDRRELLRVSW